jgi:transcriptional regulator with XRE-family HTH domain
MIHKHIMHKGNADLKQIGALLREARKQAGLTQEEIADRSGLSRPRYRDIEAGESAARATTLMNIARALGMEMMFIPQAVVPAVEAMIRPYDDDRPAFSADPVEEEQDPQDDSRP